MYQENFINPKLTPISPQQKEKTSIQTLVEQKPFKYIGICNLCCFQNHVTQDCPFAMTFYHATEKHNLFSILENGLHPNKGRLGYGLYVSDNPLMCVKYVSNRPHKFREPILLKLKVMIGGEIKSIDKKSQQNMSALREIKKQIQAIKCPYYELISETFYEFCLIEPELVVITSWRPIIESELKIHKFRLVDHFYSTMATQKRKQQQQKFDNNSCNQLDQEQKAQNSNQIDGKDSRLTYYERKKKMIQKMVIASREKANQKIKKYYNRQLKKLQ